MQFNADKCEMLSPEGQMLDEQVQLKWSSHAA